MNNRSDTYIHYKKAKVIAKELNFQMYEQFDFLTDIQTDKRKISAFYITTDKKRPGIHDQCVDSHKEMRNCSFLVLEVF